MGFNLDDYESVEERLKKYWEKYPEGQVLTKLVHCDSLRVVIHASVHKPVAAGYDLIASGIASNEFGLTGNSAQAKSPVEDCETSAIGRALANAGFSTSKRASREEMAKVNQEPTTDLISMLDGWTPEEKDQLAFVINEEMPGRQIKRLAAADVEPMKALIKKVYAQLTQRAAENLAEKLAVDALEEPF